MAESKIQGIKTATVTGTTSAEGKLYLGLDLPHIVYAVKISDWQNAFPIVSATGRWNVLCCNTNTNTPATNLSITATVYYI